MKIKLIKFNENLKNPTRSHYDDAGMDCYATSDIVIPAFGKKTIESGVIKDKYMQMIPLGFGLEVPNGYMATIRPRSSMNVKGILTQIGTIDSGYRGEIKAMLVNLTSNDYVIHKGDKICQIVIEPVAICDLIEDSLGEERGTGGFGSTGV